MSRSTSARRTARSRQRTTAARTSAASSGASTPARSTSAGLPVTAPRSDPRPSNQRTTRTAVLGLVAAALVVSAALPVQEYLSQRAEIDTFQEERAQAQARVGALEEERQRLLDPAYVAAEARRRLHFVLPGETSYVLVGPPPVPVTAKPPSKVPGSEVGATAPWYSQLWGSVRTADRPTPR